MRSTATDQARSGDDPASSAWMNHFSRIRESHPIAAAVRDDDGACRFVGCVSRPVALKLQQQLYPTAQASAGLLQPAKRELVAARCEPAARIRNDEDVESIGQGRQH